MYIHIMAYMCKIQGQLLRISCFLPTCGFRGSNTGNDQLEAGNLSKKRVRYKKQ